MSVFSSFPPLSLDELALGSEGCGLKLKRSSGGDGRGHLRGRKSSRRSQKGKNSATSRKDHALKGERVVSEVCKETNVRIWEDGMAVTSQRAVGWGMGHSLKKHALNKEEAVQ